MPDEAQEITPYSWFDPTRQDNPEGDFSIRPIPADLDIGVDDAIPKVLSAPGSAFPSGLIPDLDLSPENPVDAERETDLAVPANDLHSS